MIKTLNQRELYALAGGTVVLALLLIVFGVVFPYRAAGKRLDNRISSGQAQLKEVRQLQADYLTLKKQADQLQRDLDQREITPPVNFLEQTAGQIGGRENLVLMRPLPSVVQGKLRIETTEFKLERLGMEQVLRILQEMEQASPPMRVDRLHLKQRFDNGTQLDMSVTVSAARRN
ncbi:MAG: type II secretion system protein GspM [Desulfurivibrionaceae bacterium]|jgi:Tfp pilus assembly protein PilN|nr:type II secretion system protein M [Pseudomonadota bacterium]MCG2822548.1 type II secretion system protein M [Desulfobulbaceae bacterium]PKN23339.1 MAG: hypothetical protein CVU68_01320 [Deltaproteobacteria bacterium HGW-Deltaproteobacteria-3]MBU4230618.1 type II secretion system protein M [Pseudomonadota bacterium]MBU4407586.1 type II secretion system protein M [Pseudomonadota bacterium]